MTPHITGIGLVTALGDTVRQTWDALLSGRHISDHARIDCGGHSRASKLAIRAAREAVGEAHSPSLSNVPLVVGTSKGPVEDWLHANGSCCEGLGAIATDIARELDLRGPRLTISTACSSGLHALIRGAMMIMHGEASRVLVVASEASVHPLFIGSFDRLGILPPPGFGCRPFDLNRKGFVMSEAATAVVLDAEAAFGSVAVDRFAMAADATHITRSSDEALPLRKCIREVIGPHHTIDLVHAHGTGTPHNDATELEAFEHLVPAPAPHLYSHKGALGHSLGAAGLVSVVLNVLSHREGVIPPNVQKGDPMTVRNVKLSHGAVHRPVRRSIAVAAGFGGQIAAVGLVTSAAGASAGR